METNLNDAEKIANNERVDVDPVDYIDVESGGDANGGEE